MGVINKTVASGLAGAAAGAAAVVTYVTSTTTLVAPIPKNDPLWASEHLQNLNCLQNPVMTEICTKRVPLSRIRAELRDDESALATAFSRAVWSGWALAPQRILMTRAYQERPEAASQLFSRAELASSSYGAGTQFLNHFEVLEKSPHTGEILVRGGGSPVTARGPRETDSVLLMGCRIDRDAGEAELFLRSGFLNGVEKAPDGVMPLPYHIELLHRLYVRAMVLNGAQGLTR